MRVKLVVVLVVVVALSQAGLGLAKAGPYYVDGAHFFVKPTFRIDLSGTGSWYIGNSRWLRWSPSGASAATTFYKNVCKPNCAAGRLRPQRAKVRLFHLVACRGSLVFSQFKVVSVEGRLLLSGAFRPLGYLDRC
jgi:hypothetical protein